MAYRKVDELSLTDIANTIRSKGGTSEPLTFPDGFKSAIESIQSGGGTSISEADQWLIDFWHQRTTFAYAFYETDIENIPLIDTSKGTNFNYMFYECLKLTTISQLDVSNGTFFRYTFNGCSSLTAIPQLDVSNGTTFNTMFYGCSSLTAISFVEGCIKQNISFSDSGLLSDESIQSIIDGLADLTGGTSRKITFHSDILGKLTEEQKQQVLNKNWIIG